MSRGAAAFWSVIGGLGGLVAGAYIGARFDDPDDRYRTLEDDGAGWGTFIGAAAGAAFGAGMGPPQCPQGPQATAGVSGAPLEARFL